MKTIASAAARIYRLVGSNIRYRLLYVLLKLEGFCDDEGSTRNLLKLSDVVEKAVGQSATRQNGGMHPKHDLTKYHTFFISRTRKGASVLDIGCGAGFLAKMIASIPNVRVTGVDIDPSRISEARKRFRMPNLDFVVMDATKQLPVPSCDVVVFSNVLEHLHDRKSMLAATQQLNPEIILIRVPIFDRHWMVPLKRDMGVPYLLDPTHTAEKTAAEWLEEFCSYGLVPTEAVVTWGELWLECKRGERSAARLKDPHQDV